MRTVAYKAVFIDLSFNMRFMTVKAGGTDTMFVRMTTGTAHFRIVLARMGFKLLAFRVVMADLTGNNLFPCFILDLLAYSGKRNS